MTLMENKRTLSEIDQEYAQCCSQLGAKHRQVQILNAQIQQLSQTLFSLEKEAKEVNQEAQSVEIPPSQD